MTHFMNYKNATISKIDVSEGIDLNKTNGSKDAKFVTIGFLKILDLNLKNMFVINVMIY